MRRGLAIFLALAWLVPAVLGQGRDLSEGVVEWSELSPLPDPVGFAGPFAGVTNGALVVAGGANFPDAVPWEGGAKVWHDRVFVLEEPDGEWQLAPTRLPRPVAYGVTATWDDAVVCVGGGDANAHFVDCFALRWTGEDVEIETLPPLPVPVAFGCGVLLGDVLYLAGGLDAPGASRALHTFLALDLGTAPAERAWRELEPWPGPERHLSVAGAQDGSVFLFGGIRLTADETGAPVRVKPFLHDAWRFTPRPGDVEGAWRAIEDIPFSLAAGPTPAMPIGPAHLLVSLGDMGETPPEVTAATHPGFDGALLGYHTITDTWVRAGAFPREPGASPGVDPSSGPWPPVTTTIARWDDTFVVPSGEIRPGVRTRRVLVATPFGPTPSFGAVNYAVLVVYLASLVVMGVYFSRREKSTGDFFLGGRRVPWWAAGISIFGTQLSAITFLALPAKSYATDWLYFLQNMGIIAIAPAVVWLYLPFFRRLSVTTAYEYLELRFDLVIRMFGAFSFIAFQLARMGIVMLLPALALAAVTGMDVAACIVVMGVLCTLYTVLGGIEAVIWTDVIQVVVLFGGALVAVVIAILGVDGGVGGVWDAAVAQDKLRLVDMSWDFTGPALGVILLGAVFNNLVPYTSDQAVVQRYLTTADEKKAANAIWAGAVLSFPASILFFAVGTVLFAFYQQHAARLDPLAPTDQIFAWFIVSELPMGFAGLVVAGVFAAAMSSLDSSMNSIAAVVTTDLRRRFSPHHDDAHYLRLARWTTVVLGVAGTGSALAMSYYGFQSLIDQFLAYVGLLGGTMAGLFALGILVPFASRRGALVGAVAAVAALVFVKTQTHLSGLMYATVGMTVCFVVGLLASLPLPDRGRDLTGLTITRMKRKETTS